MELPIVDSEFLSLFLPENSFFSTEDILEDFKYYIFTIMKLSADSLIQEQINNEYENSQERRTFKSYFNERVKTVLEINNLYISTQNKIDLIKNSLEKNRSIIEDNKELFSSEKINSQLVNLNRNVQCNKSLNQSSKSGQLLELLSLPSHMINCFRNNSLSLYLEYYKYFNTLKNKENYKIIKSITEAVEKVNKSVCDLLTKMLEIDSKNIISDFNLEDVNDVLGLEIDSVLKLDMNSDMNNDTDLTLIKRLNVLLYQFNLYFKTLQLNSESPISTFEQFFNFCKDKISFTLKECEAIVNQNNKENIINSFINHIFEKHLVQIVHNSYFINSSQYSINKFKERKNILLNFLTELKIPDLTKCTSNIAKTISIINKNFFDYLNLILNTNKNSIKKYLQGVKDIKKLLSVDSQNPMKYDITIIIFNNFAEVFNTITKENCYPSLLSMPIKDKFQLLTQLNDHSDDVLSIINNFFMDNMYLLKYDQLRNEIEDFKNQLVNIKNESGIIIDFLKEIHNALGIIKLWEFKSYEENKNKWGKFLQEDIE